MIEELEKKLLVLQKKLLEHKIEKTKKKKRVDPEISEIEKNIEMTKSALDTIKNSTETK